MQARQISCVETTGPAQTRRLAAALAALVVTGDLLVLTGDLGAGKTCFTQGLGAGLGVEDRITSPTFTLAAVHRGRLVLNHLDVYRLDGPADAADLDLPELAEDGVTVIEWGERLGPLLPDERLSIELTFPPVGQDGDDRRLIRIAALGAGWADRAADLEAAVAPWTSRC